MNPSDTSTADTPQQRHGATQPAASTTTPLPLRGRGERERDLDTDMFDETHVVRGYD